MALTNRHREFLEQLADLCERYNAGFSYTTDDDGVHIQVDGENVFVGYLWDAAKELRDAAKKELQD